MSLRVKLAALFGVLAVLPLLAVGIFDYSRSLRALEALILAQTSEIAQRAANDMASRYRLVQANVGLLADNSETIRLFRAHRGAQSPGTQSSPYFRELWAAVRGDIASVSYRAANGTELLRLGDDATAARMFDRPASHVIERDVRDDAGNVLGTVRVAVRLDSVLPRGALGTRFGRSGFSAVTDERGDSIVFSTSRTGERARRLNEALGREGVATRADSVGQRDVTAFMVEVGDSTRVGTRVTMAVAPFSIVSVGTLEEFAAPLAAIRGSNLAVVVAITLAVAVAFVLFLWSATRSLAELTLAADDVSRGNLHPALPPSGRDEVGRLSGAFAYMLDRVRETMREIERSRRARAVGEFASQIAHEIRNPLTSIKLNLQKLDRGVRRGAVAPELERPLAISLNEIQRLDRVVHGVLRLGRHDSTVRAPFGLQQVLRDSIEATRPQLDQLGVRVAEQLGAAHDLVRGDPALLQSSIVNLLLNAAEAMPAGGTVHVLCDNPARNGWESSARVRCRVEDDGPGVSGSDRERIFDPFYTTKPGGTGLGLALVQRTVEEHHGRLSLEETVRGKGAAFVMELPLSDGDAA